MASNILTNNMTTSKQISNKYINEFDAASFSPLPNNLPQSAAIVTEKEEKSFNGGSNAPISNPRGSISQGRKSTNYEPKINEIDYIIANYKRKISQKDQNIKFNKNPSVGSTIKKANHLNLGN